MGAQILIVDDETAIADLVEVYLTNDGYTVHKCYNAADALACVERTPLDLAILDVMLPDHFVKQSRHSLHLLSSM